MKELFDTKPDINVLQAEYKRLLGYPSYYELEGNAQKLADSASQWYAENGKPWIYAIQFDKLDYRQENLRIDNIELLSKKLRKQFAQAQVCSAIVLVVSAGNECEKKAKQLWEEEKPDEYFFLEIYGSAVVEHLITTAGFRFCDWAEKNDMTVLPHYSPGYPGWRVEDQHQLLKLIKQNTSIVLPGDIEILESGMLKPKKSMLALFGITEQVEKVMDLRDLIPCQICSLQSCQYRRVPYKYYNTQIEDVTQLQPISNGTQDIWPSNGNGTNDLPLTLNANYSVSIKALEKWYRERLQLNILKDNSVEATFNYEGSTCSNMGRTLNFEYHIKLSPRSKGYEIISLNCNPSLDDDGYFYMCEYIKYQDKFMNEIKSEKPLLGKPLDNILSWNREFSPEGCYCNSVSREHKWGLAFEVLHYALLQNVNSNISNWKIENKSIEDKKK